MITPDPGFRNVEGRENRVAGGWEGKERREIES